MVAMYLGYPYMFIACLPTIISCSLIQGIIISNYNLRIDAESQHVFILLSFYNILCISSIFPSFLDADLCIAQGVLIQIFSLSGILWTGFIALYKFYDIRKNIQLNYLWYLIPILVFTIFTSLLPLGAPYNIYKSGSIWCWFKPPGDDSAIMFYWYGFFYAVAWAVILLIIVIYSYLYCYLKKMHTETKRLRFYQYFPFVLVILFIPLTISRSLQAANEFVSVEYSIFAALLMRFVGFFYSIVYAFNPQIKDLLFCKEKSERSSTIEAYDPIEKNVASSPSQI